LIGIANYGSFSLRNECCWQRVVVILGFACLGVHACGEGVLTPRMTFGKYLARVLILSLFEFKKASIIFQSRCRSRRGRRPIRHQCVVILAALNLKVGRSSPLFEQEARDPQQKPSWGTSFYQTAAEK
jgi:hypothetical protein